MHARILNFVHGQSVPAAQGRYFDQFDPRTGQKAAEVACNSPAEATRPPIPARPLSRLGVSCVPPSASAASWNSHA